MAKANEDEDITEILLKCHKKSVKLAIETSIRTGVPLVVSRNGKIVEIKPKYKYVRVPIKSATRKSKSKLKKCA
jgi:hypothetical protein